MTVNIPTPRFKCEVDGPNTRFFSFMYWRYKNSRQWAYKEDTGLAKKYVMEINLTDWAKYD